MVLLRTDDGRKEAFGLLVKHCSAPLYRMVRRMVISHHDADDLVQNVFLKIWTHLGEYRGEARITTWIYRIAANESSAFLQRKKILRFLPFSGTENQLTAKLKDDNWFNGDELSIKLQEAILSLPDKQRMVFNLRYFDEMPYQQMSEILGTSQGALKASFHHAVEKIKKYFGIG